MTLLAEILQERAVIFVYQNHDLSAGLLISGGNYIRESGVKIPDSRLHAILGFPFGKIAVYVIVKRQIVACIVFGVEIKMEHRMFDPVDGLMRVYGQTFEQIPVPKKKCFQRRKKQAFPESARPAQKIIFPFLHKMIDIFSLIDINIISVYDFGKTLYAYRIFYALVHLAHVLNLNGL